MKYRFKDLLLPFFTALATGVSLSILIFILAAILKGGWGRLDFSFLVTPSFGAGDNGGILYQILGTGILIVCSSLIVTPFATGLALLYTVYLKSPRMKRWLSSALHMLNATPSILFGILGFVVFVRMAGWDKSWLAGSLMLALMILPTVTVSLIQRILTIPENYIQGSQALGFNEDQVVWAILIPYGWGGLLTGIVLGIARAAGETAPIMFTAAVFSGATLPSAVKDSPVLALPYHIFNLAQDSYSPLALETAWATAAALTLMVLLFSAVVIPFRVRSHEEAKK